ncbi:MAG: hypothetical protein VX438_14540 [Planctomycetota bacterium]|jgi:hypothetical protein|nr:hypothetical protein [Planctomycetota bacterium]
MANDPNFEASAPMDSLGFEESLGEPEGMQPTAASAPKGAVVPTKKLVDVYTAMLFVAAIFLLAGTIVLAWEKQRFGEIFGNTWKIPANFKISAIEKPGGFDTDRYFLA